jgi:hypothetical protein
MELCTIKTGDGFKLDDCQKSIEFVNQIHNAELIEMSYDYYPFAKGF